MEEDVDLPRLYGRLANLYKKESPRQMVQGTIDARCRDGDAATRNKVLLTKEVFEMIKTAEFGDLGSLDGLTKGIHPFTCGFGRGPRTDFIAVRNEAYDLMSRGDTHPTVAEQFYFATKEVVLPEDPITFQEMLRATSIILDVKGHDHPHAVAFRAFVRHDVEEFALMVNNLDVGDVAMIGNVYPRFLRETQMLLVGHFNDLLGGREPNIPAYDEITEMGRRRKWNMMGVLPARYQLGPATGPSHGVLPGQSQLTNLGVGSSGGGGGVGLSATTPVGGVSNSRQPDPLGLRVTNGQPTVRAWQKRFQESNKRLNQLTPPKDSLNRDMCMSYHLRGSCFENCARKYNHTLLVGADKATMISFVDRTMISFVDRNFPPRTAAGGTPGTTPTPGQNAEANGPPNNA